MSEICWWLVDLLSRTLEPGEREAVLGDIAESGETGRSALRDLLGLAIRRQAGLWKNWRPWLGLAGIAVPAGLLLGPGCVWTAHAYDLYSWVLSNYKVMDPAVLAKTGLSLPHDLVILCCDSLFVGACAWFSGFVLGALSRRATWVSGVLFWAVLLRAAAGGMAEHPRLGGMIYAVLWVVLLPSFFGMFNSRRTVL